MTKAGLLIIRLVKLLHAVYVVKIILHKLYAVDQWSIPIIRLSRAQISPAISLSFQSFIVVVDMPCHEKTYISKMSLVVRKQVFRVSDQVRH